MHYLDALCLDRVSIAGVHTSNLLDQRAFAYNFHQRLAFISFLEDITDIPRSVFPVKDDIDTVMDTLEPYSNMGDERHVLLELGGDFPLVDVICQGIRYYVVCEIFDIILR